MAAAISPVIEIQFGNPRLQKAPHGLAHIRSQPHDVQSSEVSGPHFAEVILQKPVILLAVEKVIGGQIAQVEKQISHTAIFPIQNPNLALVINQVAGQQIIVAMAYPIRNTSLILQLP